MWKTISLRISAKMASNVSIPTTTTNRSHCALESVHLYYFSAGSWWEDFNFPCFVFLHSKHRHNENDKRNCRIIILVTLLSSSCSALVVVAIFPLLNVIKIITNSFGLCLLTPPSVDIETHGDTAKTGMNLIVAVVIEIRATACHT